ncbi:hypothetical protein WJX73_006710 [Symbiochloris irregularis]|uniref:Non-specific serine/threonine protein kinase n=1 Tax=Symbiochloris irregularis TaxID=706552 RepID=A0AAW1NTJ2_9CHLO
MEEDSLREHLEALISRGTDEGSAQELWQSTQLYLTEACISQEEKALAAVMLLDEDAGLPAYMGSIQRNKGLAGLKKLIFQWLDGFVRALPRHSTLQHAQAITMMCRDAFKIDESSYVREACLLPLTSFCQMRLPPLSTEAESLAAMLKQKYVAGGNFKLSNAVKGAVLEMLGSLLNAYPQAFEKATSPNFTAPWLVEACGSVLRSQAKQEEQENQSLLAGALAAFSHGLSHCKDDVRQSAALNTQCKAAWRHIERLIFGAASLSRYKGLHAGLQLLADQAALFQEGIMADALKVVRGLEAVKRLESKAIRADRVEAALAAVFQLIVRSIGEGAQDEGQQAQSKALLEQLVQQHVLEPLAKARPGPKVVPMALAAVTLLADPIADLMGAQGLETAIAALLPLHASAAGGEGFEGYDVPLLRALAKLLGRLPSGQQAVLPTCLQLAGRIGKGYHWLWPKQRPAANAAIQELMVALHAVPGLLDNALHQLVSDLLGSTLQQVDSSKRGRDQGVGGETPAWVHCTPLWGSLLGLNLQYFYEVPEGDADDMPGGPAGVAAQPVLKPRNAEHMLTFLNLSGFLARVLEGAPNSFARAWTPIVAQELVQRSRAQPMLSGFHHMLRSCLSCCSADTTDTSNTDMDVDVQSGDHPCTAVCAPFLQELCVARQLYTDELLAACLHLLITAPPFMLPQQELVSALQQSLTLGLQHLELADAAMRRLEAWETDPNASDLRAKVAPFLEPYLHTVVQAEQGSQDDAEESQGKPGPGVEGELGAKAAADEYKQARAEATAGRKRAQLARLQGLAALQPRIQGWLGRNPEAAAQIVITSQAGIKQQQAPATTASARWDLEDRFVVPVHLQEGKQPLQVSLDLLLPQAAKLAETAADRAVQVAACELLHGSILWIVGKGANRTRAKDEQDFDSRPAEYHGLLTHALPVALRLAASEDGVVRALFRPLIISLVHWLTRNAQREAADTMALLEAILEGLASSGRGGGLRDLCAEATQEFLVWSDRHVRTASTKDAKAGASRTNLNASSLLRRLMERLVHPDACQRLGAAKAMALCSRSLRGMARSDPTLAQDNCLELLQCCITGLRLAHSDPPGMGTCAAFAEAVKELVKVLVDRPRVLDALLEEGDEGAPAAVTAPSLTCLDAFTLWLWPLTAAPERYCRGVCMWLHERLCELLLKNEMSDVGQEAGQRSAASIWLEQLAADQSESVPETVCNSGVVSMTAAFFQSAAYLQDNNPKLGQKLQELEGRCHWVSWALSQNIISFQGLQDTLGCEHGEGRQHLREGIQAFLTHLVPDLGNMQIQSSSLQRRLAHDLHQLAMRLLGLMGRAVSSKLLDWSLPGLHTFLLGCLLSPASLGLHSLTAADSRLLALQAKGVLEAAAAADAQFVRSLQPEPEVRASLPERLLKWAAGLSATAGPEERLQGEAALQLAVRLGLKPAAMLAVLLNDNTGTTFYHHFPSAVHTWVMFNDTAAVPALCRDLSQADQGAATVLCGVLASLIHSQQPGQAPDPRQRSFLQRLLSCTDAVASLVSSSADSGTDNKAAHSHLAASARRCLFVRLLTLVLTLDAPTVLAAEDNQKHASLLQPYLSILKQIGQVQMVEQQDVLSLLRFWLHLPADGALHEVHEAISHVVKSVFPTSSQALPKGSAAAIQHRDQLLALMDALVAAAEEGADVSGALKAVGPALQALGTLEQDQDSALQHALRLRLAALASAPWAVSDEQGKEGDAEGQARALLQCAWQGIFEVHADMPQGASFRRAMLLYLLLPALQCAPPDFQAGRFKEWVPHLMSVAHPDTKPGSLPGLRRNDESSGLVAKMAAFMLFGHAYSHLPYDTLVKPELVPLWGGNGKLMALATKQAQGITCSDTKLAEAATQARAAAMAAAAALVTASQSQMKYFVSALSCAGPTWESVVSSSMQLNFSSGRTRALSRAMGGMKELAAQRKAARLAAGSLMSSTLGSLGSLGSLGASVGSLPASLDAPTDSQDMDSKQDDPRSSIQASFVASMEADSDTRSPQEARDATPPAAEATTAQPSPDAGGLVMEDDLDSHVCMLPLVRLVERAATLLDESATDMPAWMGLLHGLLADEQAPAASRLFVARLVMQVDRRHLEQDVDAGASVFGRWQQQWAEPLMKLFATGSDAHNKGLHYFLVDVCLALLRWSQLDASHPPSKEASALLVSHLVKNAYDADTPVLRNNFNLIKMLLGQWKSVPLPLPELDQLVNTVDKSGAQQHRQQPLPAGSKGVESQAKGRQAVGLKLLAVGVAYGRLQQLQEEPGAQALARDALRSVIGLSDQRNKVKQGRAITAAERLTAFHAELVDELEMSLFSALEGRLTGAQRAVLLTMLHRRAVQLRDAALLAKLQPHVPALLSSADAGLQSSCLQLLADLLPGAPEAQAGAALKAAQSRATAFRGSAQEHAFHMLRNAWQEKHHLRDGLRGPLLGLLSARASSKLRTEVTAFWHAALPKDLAERLQSLLADSIEGTDEMVSSLEAEWSMRAALLTLELAKGADQYDKAIFEKPLEQCDFQQYSIDATGKGSSGALTAPLFSQEYMAASQAASQVAGMVAATQGSTQSVSVTLDMPTDLEGIAPAQSPSPEKPGPAGRAAPGLGDTFNANTTVYRRPFKSGSSHALLRGALAKHRAKQAGAGGRGVRLLRPYRIGELPDIQQVSVASFLGPLGLMACRDASIARLTVSTLYQADAAVRGSEGAASVDALHEAYARSPKHASLVGSLQELTLCHHSQGLDPQAASSAALGSGCLQGGALQLEESLLQRADVSSRAGDAEPPAKRQCKSTSDNEPGQHIVTPAISKQESTWAAVNDIYLALGEQNLVHSSLASHIARCPGTNMVMSALAAQRTTSAFSLCEALLRLTDPDGDGELADLALQDVLAGAAQKPTEDQLRQGLVGGQEPSTAELDLWVQERMRCLEALGDWSTLEATVDAETDGDDGSLFTDQRLANYRLAFVRACLFQPSKHQRIQDLLESETASAVQADCPTEVALHAAAQNEWERSKAAATRAMAMAQEQWDQAHPLSQHLRLQILGRMQPLAELQEIAGLMQSGRSVRCSTQPQEGQMEARALAACSLLMNGARSMLQAGFLDSAQELLDACKQQSPASAVNDEIHLQMTAQQLQLQVAQAAAMPSKARVKESLRYAMAELDNSLRGSAGRVQSNADGSQGWKALQGSAHWALAGGHTSSPDCKLLQAESAAGTGNSPSMELHPDAAAGLDRAGGPAATFVQGTLQAMRHSTSCGAELHVPRALALLNEDAGARDSWLKNWKHVPLHLLLPWGAQMLSLLDADEGPCLIPALQALAASYQARLYFPYRLSRSSWGKAGLKRASELDPAMQSSALAALAEALNDTTFPAQRWDRWRQRISSLISTGSKVAAAKLYRDEVFPDMISKHRVGRMAGRRARTVQTLNSEFATKFEKVLEERFGPGGAKLESMDSQDFAKVAVEVANKQKGKLEKVPLAQIFKDFTAVKKGRQDLAHLSPWLASYSAGASDAGGEPLVLPAMTSVQSVAAGPPAELTIVAFGKAVHVFSSKQQPKRLTIYTDDFRQCEWIVKGGEEMRIDQRVEQLLGVMNGLLSRSAPCRAFGLQVETYDVVPMTESLGMVAFVPDTLPLLAVVTNPLLMPAEEFIKAHKAYELGYVEAQGKQGTLGAKYERLYGHGSAGAAVRALELAQSHVRWDSLREALLRYAGGPEKFFVDRGRFADSLAAVSIMGYCCGIGDRHLDNFLLHPPSGRLIPIDFGYSFGTATQALPVPECMPFRMTRQLIGALLPHDAQVLLQSPCSAALAALRDGKDILEGILSAYLREPLLDWQREAVSIHGSRGGNSASASDISQYSNRKIEATIRKLEGGHPADIMIQDLQGKHAGKPHWKRLQDVVKGAAGSVPAQSRERLSCDDQAACLLAMATDSGILGRSYAGWRPWL